MRQMDDAIKAYQAAADNVAGDKSANARSAHFIKCRLQNLKWQTQFDGRGWLDVHAQGAESDRLGSGRRKWTVDKDGKLTGVADEKGFS